MSHDQHRGQVVLITGAARGIGRGVAEAFAAAGAAVVVADVNGEGAERVAAALREAGSETLAVAVDVSDATQVAALVRQAIERFGRIDVLVNNAAIYPNTPVLEMDEAEWEAVFAVNVKGMFLVSRDVARTMVARGGGGRIINISSGAAVSGRIGAAHYCSSKAAVNMLTRVLAIELAPHGINVTAVQPGLIEVPNAPLTGEYVDALVAMTPLKRKGQPSDIANAVLFLAAPASSFITGTILGVDGGILAGRAALPLSRPEAGVTRHE
jgi:3-oxoacyl-[acyl-carrier protein] reductase